MGEHTGKLPFQCEDQKCEKSFGSKFKLDRHSLSHGMRKFACNSCGKVRYYQGCCSQGLTKSCGSDFQEHDNYRWEPRVAGICDPIPVLSVPTIKHLKGSLKCWWRSLGQVWSILPVLELLPHKRLEQSRGSNPNAGKTDQYWSRRNRHWMQVAWDTPPLPSIHIPLSKESSLT